MIPLVISLGSEILEECCRLPGFLPLLLTHILFIYFLVKNKALKKNKTPFLGLNPSCVWIRKKTKGSVACHWGGITHRGKADFCCHLAQSFLPKKWILRVARAHKTSAGGEHPKWRGSKRHRITGSGLGKTPTDSCLSSTTSPSSSYPAFP